MVCSHNHQVSINLASIYKLFERWSTSRRLHSQVNLVRNVVKVSYTWLNHWNSNPYIPIHSLRINILRLVEHYLLAFTMEDVHSRYEDLYAIICEIAGKCRINGNISVRFLNQKVLDTALESWALALQESTNNHCQMSSFWGTNQTWKWGNVMYAFWLGICMSFDDMWSTCYNPCQ